MNRNNFLRGRERLASRWPGGLRSPSLKSSASPTERLIAAFCHLSLLINLVYVGAGLLVCVVCYFLGLMGARYLARQASRALVGQLVVGALLAPVWLGSRLIPDWLGGVLWWPYLVIVLFIAIPISIIQALRCL